VTGRQQRRYAICWSVNDSKWYFWLVHIVPHCIRQKSGGTRYRCEGRCFSPRACWEYLLILHRQIYIYIALNKDYQKVEKDIDTEEIRKEIVGLIKVDNDESVFEFYNVYFEATRINEKLEQLKRI
jgi:hypothetical protein